MDIIGDILDTLKLSGSLYFRTAFSGEWAVTVPAYQSAARFHLVVKGHSVLQTGDGNHIVLNTGDLVLVTRGKSHILSNSPQKSAPPLETVLQQSGYDGSGLLIVGDQPSITKSTQMVCGHFSFRPKADHPLLRSLPDYIHVKAQQRSEHPLLDHAITMLAEQVFAESFGSEAAIARLSEIVFLELINAELNIAADQPSLKRALRDPKISKALSLIHYSADKTWTLDSLASAVAMSRSRFAFHFKELVGVSPMSYLADWRLQKALALLDDSENTIQTIALQTGYQSHAGFSRAFQDRFGISPTDYRRQSA